MKTVGVICECNPFHAGHAYLFERARASGADAVIALMSGCFVQRGDAAILPPRKRAETLILGGADAVLELPFPYSSAGAECFAHAGVEILDRLGVDELWFGSECGDIDRLDRLAAVAAGEEFRTRYAQTKNDTNGTAQAYFETLQTLCGEDAILSPNDILGVSYLRAIRATGASIKPRTVGRRGSGYSDETLTQGVFPSATALRKLLREEGLDAILPHLPQKTQGAYDGITETADLENAARLILGHLRLTPPDRLEQIAALSGGLGGRLSQAAEKATDLASLLSIAATKKYPMARLRRGILFALTEIEERDLRRSPAYVRLLAANTSGCAFLSEARKRASISVVTRRTDLPDTPEAHAQAEHERRAYALYDLCFASVGVCPSPWSHGPLITE